MEPTDSTASLPFSAACAHSPDRTSGLASGRKSAARVDVDMIQFLLSAKNRQKKPTIMNPERNSRRRLIRNRTSRFSQKCAIASLPIVRVQAECNDSMYYQTVQD
jgi:hypothetical protein